MQLTVKQAATEVNLTAVLAGMAAASLVRHYTVMRATLGLVVGYCNALALYCCTACCAWPELDKHTAACQWDVARCGVCVCQVLVTHWQDADKKWSAKSILHAQLLFLLACLLCHVLRNAV